MERKVGAILTFCSSRHPMRRGSEGSAARILDEIDTCKKDLAPFLWKDKKLMEGLFTIAARACSTKDIVIAN